MSPSIIEFTCGNRFNASVTALVKKDIKPNPTACVSLNFSLYRLRMSMIGFMSTSLKVVSIAVSFLTATNLEAIFLRSIFIFTASVSLVPPQPWADCDENPAAIAAKTSCFVILPSFPVP